MNYTDIVSMIMKNEDLQVVLDSMSEYLQATIVIINDNMEILAFSKAVPPRDPYWVKALDVGYCSKDMLFEIYSTHPVRDSLRLSGIRGGASYSPDHTTMKYYFALPGENFRHAISCLAFPQENKFEKRKQDLLLSFTCLIRNTYLRAENLPLAYGYQGQKGILQRMLNPDYEQSIHAESNFSVADDAFFNNVQVLVFSPKLQELNEILLYAFADAIGSFLDNDYTTVYNGSVVAVFQMQKMTDDFTENLIRIAKKSNSRIGISWEFSGKEQVRKHYKQAMYSLEMARKLRLSGRIFTYDDMNVYALMDQCRKRDYWENSEHPVLTILRDYDAEHTSCLYDTLYCLLKCGMSSTLAAKKLGVHKSTLYHRMEVLTELIPGLAAKNAEWQASVMLSFDLARLKNNQ